MIKKGTVLIAAGLLLIAAALCLILYNLSSDYQASQAVSHVMEQLPQEEIIPEVTEEDPYEVEIPDYVLNPEMDMPEQTIDGQQYIGVLEIAALELELPIISQWSYPNLKVAPCRYSGSAYKNDFVIAAHNYNAHFANLHQLEEGSRVVFTDMDGNVFKYDVVLKETLPPTAVEEMTAGDFDLSLFTCTMDGSARVTIRCDLVK